MAADQSKSTEVGRFPKLLVRTLTWAMFFSYLGHLFYYSVVSEVPELFDKALPVLSSQFLKLVIMATVLAHLLLFEPTWLGRGTKWDLALIKSIDYIWYLSGTFVLILVFNELSVFEYERVAREGKLSELNAMIERDKSINLNDLLAGLEPNCVTIAEINKYRFAENSSVRTELEWQTKVCELTRFPTEVFRLAQIVEVCTPEHRSLTYLRGDQISLEFLTNEDHISALKAIARSCSELGQATSLFEEINRLDEEFLDLPTRQRNSNQYLLISCPIGFKLSKVTHDVVTSIRRT